MSGSLASQRENASLPEAAPALSFSVSPWSAVDLTLAAHPYQLPEHENYYLTLDAKVTGLGGNSCGQGGPLEPDRVMGGQERHFSLLIRPVQGNLDQQTEEVPAATCCKEQK